MKRPKKGLARWDGKVLRGHFTISKADKLQKAAVRKVDGTRTPNAPAPGLRPPGVRGPQPQRQGHVMETWQQTERRSLRAQLVDRMRGLIRGQGSLMNVDWERFKLGEALWKRSARETAGQRVHPGRGQANREERRKAARQNEREVSREGRPRAKTNTRVRPAPEFAKMKERARVTPEAAASRIRQQQSQQTNGTAQQGQKAARSSPRTQSSTDRLFKPTPATERMKETWRENAQDKNRERER